MKYEIFFVVNDNPSTINPADGKVFDGKWCERTGHQVADPKYATPFYSHKGAVACVNRLNREGIKCPSWARVASNNTKTVGKYRIVSGTVTKTRRFSMAPVSLSKS